MRSVVLGATAVLATAACTDGRPPTAGPPTAGPPTAGPPTASPPTVGPPAAVDVSSAVAGPTSDLAGLVPFGIDIGTGVLIDIAGDGRDRFLRVGRDGVADFGGTSRQDSTLMVLHPAATTAAGRVVITAPRWNPDLGGGYCVGQAAALALSVRPCRPGDPNQIWHVVLVGNDGQFRLVGRYGNVTRDGLQTVPFSE